MSATKDDLLNIHEIGERIADSVQLFFQDAANREEIESLRAAGLNLVIQESDQPASDLLSGKTFVISGVFSSYGRDELKLLIKQHGGKVVSSISGNLDYLLAGDKMGPAKLKKAEKLNINIISEDDFDKMIGN